MAPTKDREHKKANNDLAEEPMSYFWYQSQSNWRLTERDLDREVAVSANYTRERVVDLLGPEHRDLHHVRQVVEYQRLPEEKILGH